MGVIGKVLGTARAAKAIGDAAEGLSEVFLPNATRAMELDAEIHRATLEGASAEFEHAGDTGFDRAINGLNRLPRPFLALGTLGLFGFAMWDPVAFNARMIGLAEVPEPLWWLLGAIVSFYFGARELHYARHPPETSGRRRRRRFGLFRRKADQAAPPANTGQPDNAALSAWRGDAP